MGVIILDRGLYCKLNKNILQDSNTYTCLPYNPTNQYSKLLKYLLEIGRDKGVLTTVEADRLFVENPIVPILHSLPKVHKEVFPPPLRPIIAGIGSMEERLSAWMNSFLQPLVSLTPAFIKDTKHIVNIMDGQEWQNKYMWLACDVIGLYPAIPHERALNTIRGYLDTYS